MVQELLSTIGRSRNGRFLQGMGSILIEKNSELLSNLVFEACGSCGDLAVVGGFNSVFEGDACDDFGQVIKAA
jgi:hypothetical protein